jgi:hypothetical protein
MNLSEFCRLADRQLPQGAETMLWKSMHGIKEALPETWDGLESGHDIVLFVLPLLWKVQLSPE